jgi:UDP-N-acetylmuramoyl-tripeptide--D-alanyl-D-alanine ligase
LAITGSNGKTTTKELISTVLSKRFRVHATTGNLNNHIGVPLTLLSAPANTEFLLVEMGANHVGEINRLCEISNPTYGIITNIGRAHLDGFGSVEGITKAKSELYKYLSANGGVALYNNENKILNDLIGSIGVKSYPYNRPANSHISISKITNDPALSLIIRVEDKTHTIKTYLFGEQNIENILAAVACGIYFDIEMPEIIEALAAYKPDNNRSQITTTSDNIVICDAYNANPTSMQAAIQSFIAIGKSPKTLILGDMLELGEYADKEHLEIVSKLSGYNDLTVILVGPIFSKISQDFGFLTFPDVYELAEYLSVSPIKDSFVLVKGSRGIKLETIYPQL